jgi:hypothetical protein
MASQINASGGSIAQYLSPGLFIQIGLPCEPPEGMKPLFDLLNSFVEIAFIAGIAFATLGFLWAGILFMMGGEDTTRRGKRVARNTLIGTVLLLGANTILAFLISQLGTPMCG